ncbi:carbamoyltransferase HypF [Yoonia sp.]|uniref:carbamoyltransferase HypF n=1 Tax=Yoonia sp. TaxID=2212373 RepID=UPI00358E87FA
MAILGRHICLQGRVQGVGFRPFVWHLATEAQLKGHVRNDGTGVQVEAWGTKDALDRFLAKLVENPPPLANVAQITWKDLAGDAPTQAFFIAHSDHGPVRAEITPDAATCPACLTDIRDPANRRYRYPFTNCTHCGPRLSIITGIPYDRAQTAMRKFTMCDACQREYSDPSDRRFYAQPNACPACGPQLWLEDEDGPIACADPVSEAARKLRQGQIIAIKGIGGFHLACDATDATVVQRLRDRKNRIAKPFAIMAKDLAQVWGFCQLSDAEADLLAAPAAPIVLLLKSDQGLPECIAPDLDRIGVMLPHAPLHHLLLAELDGPLIMTSGNPANCPQITLNDDARRALTDIADAWLMHDRDIVNRLDDSLIRADDEAPSILRRGRGMAPAPIPLHPDFATAPPTLAMGAELKATFCLLNNGQAVLSQHIGDLKTADTYADYRAKIDLYRDLYGMDPAIIAVDMHQDYLSTRWGAHLAKDTGAKLVPVQHHHAHMASCLAAHHIAPDEALCVGVILDGTGLGTDGTIWGGEFLLGDYCGFERKAHFQPVALAGGEQAVREPWRNLVAQLTAAFGEGWEQDIAQTPLSQRLAAKPTTLINQMIAQGLNAPLTSSAGRLFDAVAAALGIAFDQQHYEGQAAMELEAMIGTHPDCTGYAADVSDQGVISWKPLWSELLSDLKNGVAHGTIAARFHIGLADTLAETAMRIASDAQTTRIVLSGGVMQNRFLVSRMVQTLRAQGFHVMAPKTVPANDGGLSLGQAAIAAFQP